VLLEGADIAEAAETLGKTEEEFIATHTALAQNRAQLTLKEKPDGTCEFLDETGICHIYAARPRQCRDFPHQWHVAGCPGLAAPLHTGEKQGRRDSAPAYDG
jgi:uncharacterized protein